MVQYRTRRMLGYFRKNAVDFTDPNAGALLSVAELQAKRKEDQARLRERMGSGMPGVTSGRGGGGGGGGGRRSGGS